MRATISQIAGLLGVMIALAQPGASSATEQPYLVPPRPLPVPETVSGPMQALIGSPQNPSWNQHPASAAAWRALVKTYAKDIETVLPALMAREKVTVRADRMNGVPVFWIEPTVVPVENKDRILVNFHGGAYVFAPGKAGLRDAILLAGRGFRVISVDYRMAPDAPYPAAIDDAEAVWKAIVAHYPAKRIGVFGSSTGGAMTLALVVRAKAHHLPLPGALWAGTPWAQLDKVGDSYFTNDHVDNALVSYDGLLGAAAALYANGHVMSDPELSPVNADFKGFPPTLLTTGTRDLFLSNTIRVHRKLKQAGVAADLNVYEGLSHGDYERDPDLPESREVYGEAAAFFGHALAR